MLFWGVFWILLTGWTPVWPSDTLSDLQPVLITHTGMTSLGSENYWGNIWTVPHLEQNKEPKPRDDKSENSCFVTSDSIISSSTICSFIIICFTLIFLIGSSRWSRFCLLIRIRSPLKWWEMLNIKHLSSVGLTFLTSCHDCQACWRRTERQPVISKKVRTSKRSWIQIKMLTEGGKFYVIL